MAHTHQMRAQLRATWRKGQRGARGKPGLGRSGEHMAGAGAPSHSGPAASPTSFSARGGQNEEDFNSAGRRENASVSLPVSRIVCSNEEILRQRDKFLTRAEAESLVGAKNPADTILRMAGAQVKQHLLAGHLDSILTVAINEKLDELGRIQGACERIANTPLPFPYTLLVHRTVYLYILLAPFAMAQDMGYYTALFNAILAYTFFGLDELARQLESPFGEEQQCLALDAISTAIEISVAEFLGQIVFPPELLSFYPREFSSCTNISRCSARRGGERGCGPNQAARTRGGEGGTRGERNNRTLLLSSV